MFRDNQVVPAPDDDLISEKQVFDFPTSQHGFDMNEDGFNTPDDGVSYYNHEFGGFSKKLTRETPLPLAPGDYTIKIVVQDVFDRSVDSAVFVEAGSLKLFTLAAADYNGDGVVDSADYAVWSSHFSMTPATFYDGDGNGDCVVDAADYSVWRDSLGATGNGDYRADFNRDGMVNGLDYFIWLQYAGLLECASRFEGDANGDGAVNRDDLDIWMEEFGSGVGMMAAMQDLVEADPLLAAAVAENAVYRELKDSLNVSLASVDESQIPEDPDVNGDGVVDEKDVAILDQIILGIDPAEAAE